MIYLDSSDYSELSNSKLLSNRPDLREGKRLLEGWIDEELVEVWFSVVIVSEIAPVDVGSKVDSIERSKILKRLSKGNALSDFRTLVDGELHALATGNKLDHSIVRNQDGDWLPSLRFDRYELVSGIEKTLYRTLSEQGIPRGERRGKIGKLIKNGKLSKAGKEMVAQMSTTDFATMNSQYPISDSESTSTLFKQFILNQIDESKFSREVKKLYFDVEFFIDCLVDKDGFDRTPKWLREIGEENKARLESLRSKIRALYEREIELGGTKNTFAHKLRNITRSSFKTSREKLAESKWDRSKKELKSMGISHDSWCKLVMESNLGDIASVDAYGECVDEYMLNTASQI
ncbi:MAG: hypothetical protein HUJ11_02225, partial [Arenibacter algicola]|nr:hypothetical protein [Arenibacter algicola]